MTTIKTTGMREFVQQLTEATRGDMEALGEEFFDDFVIFFSDMMQFYQIHDVDEGGDILKMGIQFNMPHNDDEQPWCIWGEVIVMTTGKRPLPDDRDFVQIDGTEPIMPGEEVYGADLDFASVLFPDPEDLDDLTEIPEGWEEIPIMTVDVIEE